MTCSMIGSTSIYGGERLCFMGPNSVKVQNRVQTSQKCKAWGFFKGPYRKRMLRHLRNINIGNSGTSRDSDSSKFRLQLTLSWSRFLTRMPKLCPPSALQSLDLASDQNPSGLMSRAWKCIFCIVYFYLESVSLHYSYLISDMFIWRYYVLVHLSNMQMINKLLYLSLWCICEWTSDHLMKPVYKFEGFQIGNFSEGITC